MIINTNVVFDLEKRKFEGKIIERDNLIITDHTESELDCSDQGTRKKLLLKIVEKARQKDSKIISLCSLANSFPKKIPQIQDMVKD